MTDDLTKALAEMRRVTPPNSPWEAGDIGVGSSPVDYHIATILNAAASGDLIPKADADLAVAMMVEKAAEIIEEQGQWMQNHNLSGNGFDLIQQGKPIRALAPASALAELQALRDSAAESEGNLAHALHQLGPANAELATLRAQVERLTGALTIAANRLHRCSVDYDTGTREFIEVGGWADEARAALTEGAAP